MPTTAQVLVRTALARAFRPGMHAIEQHARALADRASIDTLGVVWRGGLDGHAVRPDGSIDPVETDRMRGELVYWVRAVRGLDPAFGHAFSETFARWQRTRLFELARCLGLTEGLAAGEAIRGPMADWCASRSVVEIGGGPWPCVAAARWASAAVIDPLASGYAAEGLIAPESERVVFVGAAGEAVPLADGVCDLVICENCLDHVNDPARVAREMARILAPGGLLWLLVDVMDHADALHPHPMNVDRSRALLAEAGLQERWGEVWDGKSHPRAHGQWRTLWARPKL